MTDSDDDLLREIANNNKLETTSYIKSIYQKFDILDGYTFLTLDNIEDIQPGDHVLYLQNGYPTWGGLFIKLNDYNYKIKNNFLETISEPIQNTITNISLLLKIKTFFYNLNYTNNYIFFKTPPEKSDVLREFLLKKI
jgi:hypothetical protein